MAQNEDLFGGQAKDFGIDHRNQALIHLMQAGKSCPIWIFYKNTSYPFSLFLTRVPSHKLYASCGYVVFLIFIFCQLYIIANYE